MILPDNGFIEVEQTTGGGLVDGIPTIGTTTYQNEIPCHILKNTENNKGDYKDGKFTNYSFIVWLEMQDFEAKRVRITDNKGNVKGVFEVQSVEHLDLVQRVKIII